MDEALQRIALHAQFRIAEAAVADLRARYDLGGALHTVRYAEVGRFEPRVIEDLASLLGVHVTALQRQARVAEVIKPMEFEALAELRSRRGKALTWSHLERLATVRCRERRERIARIAAEEGIGVREMGAMLRGA